MKCNYVNKTQELKQYLIEEREWILNLALDSIRIDDKIREILTE